MRLLFSVTPYLIAVLFVSCNKACADAISPKMHGNNHTYSRERASTHIYGTGVGGRKTEASVLRMTGEGELDSAQYEQALRHLGKAVKLDPGDPSGHVLYAQALTGFFYSKSEVDEEMLDKLITEWTLIARHDADQEDQGIARDNLRKLKKIRKALANKQKMLERKQLSESTGKESSSVKNKLSGMLFFGRKKSPEPKSLADSGAGASR